MGRSPCNERPPFRFHGAVVGFVDRCLSRTRNLAASFLTPILTQHLPRNCLFRFFKVWPFFFSSFMLIMSPLFAYRAKKPLHTGVRTGCHYISSLSVRLSVCVTFVIFTDCESCTRSISTNPGSMETGEYGLTRGCLLYTSPSPRD